MQKIFQPIQLLLLVTVAFTAVQCSDTTKAADKNPEISIPVTVQPVKDTVYASTLTYSGTMASLAEARLSFKVGGIISKIYVREGDRVRKGQLLATLDMTEISAQVRQAGQQLEKATRDEARIKNLYADTVATLEQVQNAGTQREVAEQSVRIAQFNERFAQIRATEDGTVLRKMMNEGELASAGAPVFLLNGSSNNDWVIRFGVADKDWAVLKKGDHAVVSLDAYPGKQFTGTITEISQGADPASGTYEVEVKVQPGTARFAAGLFATVQLQPSYKQAISFVPIEAITEASGTTGYVYRLNEDKRSVSKLPVTIAFLEPHRAAISRGLDGVPEVVTGGVGYLTEQAIVKVIHQ